jgi:RHS repeat-associated protein
VSDWQFVSKAFDLSDGTEDEMTPKYIKISLNYSRQGNSAYFDNFALVKEPAASYNYDNDGHLISITETSKQSKAMEYDDDGHLTKYTDPKDYVTTYAYNAHGKLEKTTDNLGAEYTNEYDNNGFLTSTVGKHTYEGVTLRSRTKQNLSVDTSTNSYTITSYDSMNNSSEAKYNAKTGTLTSAKDKNNNETNYIYGPNNDLMTEVSASGHTVSYSYDNSYKHLTGVSTSSTTYSFTYDNFGNRTATNVGSRTLATYTYNPQNSSISRMDYGNGDYVTYTYDKYGNVSEKYTNGTLTYQGIADNTGTITKVIDPVNNLSYTSSYDSTDRLIGTTVTDTTTNSRKAAFEYDFDNSNHISNLTTTTPSGTTSIEYEYRKEDLPIRSEIADGKKLTLSYDGLGRVKATKLNTSTAVWNYYTYHGFTESNKTYTSTLLRTEQNKDFGFKYNYDKNGNMTKLFVGTNTGGTDYTYSATETERYYYDALGQLTQVNYNDRNRRVVYTYDNAGNILSEKTYDISGSTPTLLTTNTYTYGDSSWGDLLTGYNNNTFTYDTIGNPLNYRDGITFTWSNGRQLQSYSKGSTSVTYTYDNSGLRLSKNVNGTQYSYLYHGGNLMQETVGTKILDYFYDASGNPLAVKYRTSANATGTYYYYARNSRGDVIGLYNAVGSLYCTYSYDVWGNILSVKDANGTDITSQTDIAHLQSLRYRGYYYDSDTGFYYLQSRYCDPVTHRFINADDVDIPLLSGGNVYNKNLFACCDNNSIIRSDKGGQFWNTVIGAFAGAIVGGISAAISGTDILAGMTSGAIAGGIAGAALDIVIATGGTGIVALAAVSLASGFGSALGSYTNQRMNGVPSNSIDWGAVAIDGVWGAVGGALSFGVADVGGPTCLTTRQIVSQPVNRVVSQAFGDLSTNLAIGTGTSLNSMAVNRMIKGEPDRQTRTASKPTRKTNNSRRRSFRGYTI